MQPYAGQLPAYLLERLLEQLLREARGTGTVAVDRLYEWLGVVSDPRLQVSESRRTAIQFHLNWNSEMLQALIAHGVETRLRTGEDLTDLMDRLLLGVRPWRHAYWCLEMALATKDPRAASFYVSELAACVIDGGHSAGLTVDAARAGLAGDDELVQPFDEMVQALARGHSQTDVATAVKSTASTTSPEDTAKQRAWQEQVTAQARSLQAGQGTPQLLHRAAEAYLGIQGDPALRTPHERLGELLGSRVDLIDLLVAGLETSISRPDLPGCDEVVQAFDRRLVNPLVLPFVAGLHSMEQSGALSVSDLNERQVRLAVTLLYMLAQNVVDPNSEDGIATYRPKWFQALLREDPALVADIVRSSSARKLTAGEQPPAELRELAKAEDHRKVAELASLPILESFASAESECALTALCWTLKAALTTCEWSEVGRLIDNRFEENDLGAAERSCWLAAGYLIAPGRFRKDLRSLADDQEGLKWLARFVAAGRFPQNFTKRFTADDFGPFIVAMGQR